MTDEAYVDAQAMDEIAIQTFFVSNSSALSHLYIVATQSALDNTSPANPLYASGAGLGWPRTYITQGTSHTAFAAGDPWEKPPNGKNYSPPAIGYQGVSFAHVLAKWCAANEHKSRVMLVHLQKEHQQISNDKASDLEKWEHDILGVKLSNGWVTPQVAQGVLTARDRFIEASTKGLPVAESPHGGYFWQITGGIYDYALGKNLNFALGFDWTTASPVSLFSQTQASYALFKYTNYVKTDLSCGGVCLFMSLWAQYHFDQSP